MAAGTAATLQPAVRGGRSVHAAVLLATARSAEGGPAALLPWADGTLVARLAGQLATLGVPRAVVVTRPGWEADIRAALAEVPLSTEVRASPSLADDLELVAALAHGDGGIVVMYADMVTHREALAGLLADPRVASGILTGHRARAMVFRTRGRRGRLISASSPYHAVHRPTAAFLGALKVAPDDLPALARAARALAPLAADPPEGWLQELGRKEHSWRLALWRAAAGHQETADFDDAADEDEEEVEEPAEPVVLELSDENEARLSHRLAAAPDDAAALLLVGLVREGVQLTGSNVRRLFWTRPLSAAAAAEAERDIAGIDEDRVLLDSAVKGSDGFFTTYFVSPYSRYIARWAARRGFTPNQVTSVSVLIGLAAAIAFATGERWGLVAGAVLLQVAFTTDCVDGQLARYTRTFSKLGAWLDSVFDRTKEYLAFAGLAVGASRAGDPVWLLACTAITLQTARHMSDFAFGGSQRDAIGVTPQPPVEQALDAAGQAAQTRRGGRRENTIRPRVRRPLPERVLDRWHQIDHAPGVRWSKKMIAFPIGERFAVISLTAALFTPRVTFVALLTWGGLAALYTQTGRALRSLRASALHAVAALRDPVAVYRDDGPIAGALGALLGRAVPLPGPLLIVIGLAPLLAATAIGGGDTSRPVAAAVIAWFVLTAGASRGGRPRPRFRWAELPLLRAGEYTALIWIAALEGPGAYPAVFALLAALAFRHYDLVYRLRYRGVVPAAWVSALSGGWDGRLVVAFLLLVSGALPAGYFVAAAVLGTAFVAEAIYGWLAVGRVQRPLEYDDAEDEGQ